jgi:threonine aldolase
VFIALGDRVAAALRATGFLFHDWRGIGEGGVRLVTSFDTSEADVDALVAAAGLAAAG